MMLGDDNNPVPAARWDHTGLEGHQWHHIGVGLDATLGRVCCSCQITAGSHPRLVFLQKEEEKTACFLLQTRSKSGFSFFPKAPRFGPYLALHYQGSNITLQLLSMIPIQTILDPSFSQACQ